MKYDSGIFCGQPVGIHRGLHLWYRRWCDHQAGIGRHECDERIMYSFLSGCTVLTMSVVSVYKNMRAGKKLNLRIATLLAVGAAVGGVAGKMMFMAVKTSVGNENFVGMVQAIVLIGVTGITFVYTIFKKKIHTLTLNNAAVCVIVGLVLGIMSSFLGIGGGLST